MYKRQALEATVTELVRIAKPGQVVAIESVSSTCTDALGMGVPKSFWSNDTFSIDGESIEFANDSLVPNLQRYHVFMKKSAKRSE